MRYDKSLKLLNYAKVLMGNLQLFTELDHSFIVGDKVFIVGGYYDNCNQQMYSTADPFTNYSTGYEIIFVDYNTNSFVVKYPLVDQVDPLIYPYGVAINKFGNPFNNSNISYNNYTTSMQKDVYVSTTTFTKGILKKGIVNNGIFGNDYHTVLLNNKGPVSGTATNTDIVVNHMIGKKIEISKGTFNSKTDVSNFPTTKFKLNENLSAGTAYNPFLTVNVATGNNNNNFGYNYFERFTNTTPDVIINNGTFANPNNSYIAMNNLVINKAKLGANTFNKPLANQMDTISINSGYVGNINPLNDIFTSNGATINTFIPITLQAGNPTYNGSLNSITFAVDYDVIANQYFTTGQTCYVSGILGTSSYDLTHVSGTISAMSYTFGVINSATITIIFNIPNVTTVPAWTAWKIANPVTNFNFTNMKLHLTQHIFEAGYFNNSTVSSYFDSTINFTTGDLYLENSTSIESYMRGVTLSSDNSLLGVDKARSTYLTLSKQINQELSSSIQGQYLRVYDNLSPLKLIVNSSLIEKGVIHNSLLTDVTCIPRNLGDQIYLYQVSLKGLVYLDDAVNWDRLDTKNITLTTVAGAFTIVPGSYLGNDRYTPWTTQIEDAFYPNINKYESLIHSTTSGERYQSQSIAKSTVSTVISELTNFEKKYHVPTSQNILVPLVNTDVISIIDQGSLTLTSSNWGNNFNRRDILYAGDLLSTEGAQLETEIDDRRTANTSGVNDTDFPFVAGASSYRDLKTIDNNYTHSNTNYFKNAHSREASEIRINVHSIPPLVAPFSTQYPDPNYGNALITRCRIQGAGTFEVTPGSTTAITNGSYPVISLKIHNQIMINGGTPATIIPECFIEVERVTLNTWTAGFGAIIKTFLYNTNYIYQNKRTTNPTAAGAYTNLYMQLPENGLDLTSPLIRLQKNPGQDAEVIIEYWVTWYRFNTGYLSTVDGSKNGYQGGFREKRTQIFRFN